MPWTSPSTRSTGYTVTAANWNELVNNQLFVEEVAYAEFTADVSVTATTVGTANQIVSAGPVTYEAVPHLIEIYICTTVSAAMGCRFILRDSTTVLGTLAIASSSTSEAGLGLSRRITPTAAAHTYNVAAWLASAGTWTMKAGTGGTAGDTTTYLPGYIRVTRLPT